MDKNELGRLLKIDEKRRRAGEIERVMQEPTFWQDQSGSQSQMKELASLKKFIETFDRSVSEAELRALELTMLLSGPHDERPAILSIYAGAGGTDAQDWAEMLMRMYLRFAEQKELPAEIIEISSGEEAGIRSCSIKVDGPYAYGWLKSEAGVHRLVRQSPFSAAKLRHTSFALVDVIPELEAPELTLRDEDLKIDVFRAGGHGGQGVNTTDSAVRITHLPTNTVVTVQNERSQHQNKETALKILKSRISLQLEAERSDSERALRQAQGAKREAEFGSQIRNYVLHPYRQVKDVRTGVTSGNPEAVLNGQLDEFVEGYLRSQAEK